MNIKYIMDLKFLTSNNFLLQKIPLRNLITRSESGNADDTIIQAGNPNVNALLLKANNITINGLRFLQLQTSDTQESICLHVGTVQLITTTFWTTRLESIPYVLKEI
jgi:hypothetical protein